MKKIFAACVILILSTILSVNCFAFTDIVDSQLEKQIEDLSKINIINGYDDGTFKPQNNITRAEFSKMVMESIINDDLFDTSEKFDDVTLNHWAYDYIYKAKHLGIVNGTSENTFEPEENITYEQVIKMLVCAIGYGEDAMVEGGWPNGYIKQANKLGILKNVMFEQTEYATRGNVAIMIRNALDVPFYFLKSTDVGIIREYCDICIFDIKSEYLNINIDEEYKLYDEDDTYNDVEENAVG